MSVSAALAGTCCAACLRGRVAGSVEPWVARSWVGWSAYLLTETDVVELLPAASTATAWIVKVAPDSLRVFQL